MYHHLAPYYDQIFPFKETWIKELSPWIKKGEKAVDLGCATGHLVHALHEAGMIAIGIDLDRHMIDMAHHNYPSLLLKAMDMIDFLSQSDQFELITCLGNTLPHLNQNQLDKFFSHLFLALAKDGTAIIQMLNYNKIIFERPKMLPIIKHDDLIFERYYHYHKDFIEFETHLTIDDQTHIGKTILYPYTKEMLIDQIENHGLHVEIFSQLNFLPWSLKSTHQTLIITHKR